MESSNFRSKVSGGSLADGECGGFTHCVCVCVYVCVCVCVCVRVCAHVCIESVSLSGVGGQQEKELYVEVFPATGWQVRQGTYVGIGRWVGRWVGGWVVGGWVGTVGGWVGRSWASSVMCESTYCSLLTQHSSEDEQLIEACLNAGPPEGEMIIFDARSSVAATGNMLKVTQCYMECTCTCNFVTSCNAMYYCYIHHDQLHVTPCNTV